MLRINNLTKKYENVIAANNINLDVNDGEVAVLLGPNGAGKSTTIKSIAGLLRYEGEITINGYDNKSLDAKRIFGYVPEAPAVYEMLTIDEHLDYIAVAYKLDGDVKKKKDELLELFDLLDKRDKLGSKLSKGMQQKVSICCALLVEPKVILFDEPMIGLDPKAIKNLKNYFTKLKQRGCTVIISTHIIDSIEEVWDKALIMKKGEVIFARTRVELEQKGETLEQIFFKVTEEE